MSVVPPAVRKVSEAAFQKAVVELAETCRWLVFHIHDSRREVRPGKWVGDRLTAGFPDIVAVRDTRILFIELKSEKGRLRPSQTVWLDALRLVESVAGGHVLVRVWRPSQWDSGEIARLLARRDVG